MYIYIFFFCISYIFNVIFFLPHQTKILAPLVTSYSTLLLQEKVPFHLSCCSMTKLTKKLYQASFRIAQVKLINHTLN